MKSWSIVQKETQTGSCWRQGIKCLLYRASTRNSTPKRLQQLNKAALQFLHPKFPRQACIHINLQAGSIGQVAYKVESGRHSRRLHPRYSCKLQASCIVDKPFRTCWIPEAWPSTSSRIMSCWSGNATISWCSLLACTSEALTSSCVPKCIDSVARENQLAVPCPAASAKMYVELFQLIGIPFLLRVSSR